MNKEEEKGNEEEKRPYIREKIVLKKTPLHFVRKMLEIIFLAAVFGLVAGGIFLAVTQKFDSLPVNVPIAQTTEAPVVIATHPAETEARSETDENETIEETVPETIDEAEMLIGKSDKDWIRSQIQAYVDANTLDMKDVVSLNKAEYEIYEKAKKSLVTVQWIDENADYFSRVLWETTGMIFYKDDLEADRILVLINTEGMQANGTLQICYSGSRELVLPAEVKGEDHVLGLAVISASLESLTKEEKEQMQSIEVGNIYQLKPCDFALLAGEPYGIKGSVAVGRVTAVSPVRTTLDSVYRNIYTNIILPENGTGFMINSSGKMVGILAKRLKEDTMSTFGVAVGIEEINTVINNMSNGVTGSLLGVYGDTITKAISEETGMPEGVYVTDVLADGPAYHAGISGGDIIISVSKSTIKSMTELFSVLNKNHLPDETVIVTVLREGPEGYRPIELSVKLGAR